MADSTNTLAAVRDERERTIAVLSEGFAADLLDYDEFEDRIDRAHRARTVEELLGLRRDLSDLPVPAAVAAPVPAPREPTATSNLPATIPRAGPPELYARKERQRLVSFMGLTQRRGNWRPARTLRVISFMGATELDFRDADLPPGVTELKITALMGNVEITVPPNLAVRTDEFAFMGAFEHVDRIADTPDPEAPVLWIKGAAVMGAVQIELRLPGESRRQARRRRRHERRRLRGRHDDDR